MHAYFILKLDGHSTSRLSDLWMSTLLSRALRLHNDRELSKGAGYVSSGMFWIIICSVERMMTDQAGRACLAFLF